MSGTSLIIDTNIALYLLGGDTTLAEVLDGKTIYLSFISDCIIIDINKEIKNRTTELRRIYRLKLPDAIIGATAAYLKQPLMTADRDFQKINAINIIFYEK